MWIQFDNLTGSIEESADFGGVAGLEARQLDYIIGARERNDAVVKKIVMENDGPLVPMLIERP